MTYIPDNYDMWEAHGRAMEAELSKLPKCHECGEPIQSEDCWEFDGKYICENCLDAHRVPVEDLMGW